jgi:hypothetical protein
MPASNPAVPTRRRRHLPVLLGLVLLTVLTGALAAPPPASGSTSNVPTAAIRKLYQTRTGAWLKGWAAAPGTSGPIKVRVTVDGSRVVTVVANKNVPGRPGHGFATAVPLTSGQHTVCAIGLNPVVGGKNSAPACRTSTYAFAPVGYYGALTRATDGTNALLLRGWAFDPDTDAPISVAVSLDGAAAGTAMADRWRRDVGTEFPRFGHRHGFAVTVPADDAEHTVCVTATDVGGGADSEIGCKTVDAVSTQPPSAPENVVATAGQAAAKLAWDPPTSDGGAPVIDYLVSSTPATATITVPAGTQTTTIAGLRSGTAYTFSVVAENDSGISPAGVSDPVTVTGGPPPQRTPAPVSTSRYIRNVHGASTADLTAMRKEGYADARANPSGHRYLILLDIGGQDEYDGGVVLSATTRFVSYSDLEKDLRAYVDGYRSGQRASSPVIIAAGTNNDMDVSSSAGSSWASHVVGPLRRYALHYSGVRIAGADDMEPGFRATYAQTSAWLTGFLGATKAPFVFNGSADGCSWTQPSAGCNNGWWMTGLYHLAAGAAPTRITNLPQIYNTTMAAQWKYISLTGIGKGRPRVNFGGPLTEWTACDQAGGCGSLPGHQAWTALWHDLQSDSRLAVNSLPFSTDLRIDS